MSNPYLLALDVADGDEDQMRRVVEHMVRVEVLTVLPDGRYSFINWAERQGDPVALHEVRSAAGRAGGLQTQAKRKQMVSNPEASAEQNQADKRGKNVDIDSDGGSSNSIARENFAPTAALPAFDSTGEPEADGEYVVFRQLCAIAGVVGSPRQERAIFATLERLKRLTPEEIVYQAKQWDGKFGDIRDTPGTRQSSLCKFLENIEADIAKGVAPGGNRSPPRALNGHRTEDHVITPERRALLNATYEAMDRKRAHDDDN